MHRRKRHSSTRSAAQRIIEVAGQARRHIVSKCRCSPWGFSAKLSPELAEEVAQSVFLDLARDAHKLPAKTVLAAWLYQVARRTAIDVVRREMRRHVREKLAQEISAMNTNSAEWSEIEPLLDEAMQGLDERDRTAILLRYFENKSVREIGESLGTSENAAQKRLSRAIERLSQFFTSRGIRVGVGGLAAVISNNAIQAVPVGLPTAISAAVAQTATTTAITTTAVTAMTTLQKSIVAATLAAAIGTGVYQARRASALRTQLESVEAQLPKTEQFNRLRGEHNEATAQLLALRAENDLEAQHSRTASTSRRGDTAAG